MELNQNREFLKGAVTGILYNEQQGACYPNHPFTFNVIKEGTFWELQFIYTEDIQEVKSGVSHMGRDEYIPQETTGSFKEPIYENCDIEDLTIIVKHALEHIYKMEYRG